MFIAVGAHVEHVASELRPGTTWRFPSGRLAEFERYNANRKFRCFDFLYVDSADGDERLRPRMVMMSAANLRLLRRAQETAAPADGP